MRIPGVIHAERLVRDWPQAGLPDGRWVMARPLPFYSLTERWRVAWMVFTGRADALIWEGQDV